MNLNNHFNDEIWLDVVRGIPTPDGDDVQNHLKSGCKSCESSFQFWSGIRDSLPNALGSSPSEEAVQSVLRAFDFHRKVPLLTTLAQFASLFFDSAMEPAPAGIRGGGMAARRLIHVAQEAMIDFRIEHLTGPSSYISGQVQPKNPSLGEENLVTVYLIEDNKRIIAHTPCNEFGEFQLEFRQRGQLSMYLDKPGSPIIGIPLPDSPEAASGRLTQ